MPSSLSLSPSPSHPLALNTCIAYLAPQPLVRTHARCISRSLPRDCLTLSSARRATLAQSRSLYLSLVYLRFLSHTNDISPCSGLDRHTLYSLTQIVYLGQSIQATPTLSTSWRAMLTQSLSLSVCLDWPRSFSDKNDITMFEPNSTYSHCILSHAHRLSRSLSPTRLTLSIARWPYVIGWPCFLPRTKYIYTSVTGSSLKLYLTALTLAKKLNRTISLQSIYICSMNVGPHSLCLSIYMSLDWPRFLTPYLPRVEATTSPSLAKPELFTLRGALQPWINLCRHLFRSV